MDIILDPNILFLDQVSWENRSNRLFFIKQLDELLTFVAKNTPFKVLLSDNLFVMLYSKANQPWRQSSDSVNNATISLLDGLLIRSMKKYECVIDTSACQFNPEFNSAVGYEATAVLLNLIFNVNSKGDSFYFYLSQFNTHFKDGFSIDCGADSFSINSVVVEKISSWIQDDRFLGYLMDSLSARNWRPDKEKFPNTYLVSKLIPDNASVLQSAQDNPDERIALSLSRGGVIARMNGYRFSVELSALNSSKSKIRQIYYAGSGNEKIYLSIDVKTIAFEVCDYNGKHIGEYNFDGKQTKVKDKVGGHDILLK